MDNILILVKNSNEITSLKSSFENNCPIILVQSVNKTLLLNVYAKRQCI